MLYFIEYPYHIRIFSIEMIGNETALLHLSKDLQRNVSNKNEPKHIWKENIITPSLKIVRENLLIRYMIKTNMVGFALRLCFTSTVGA